MNFLKTLFAPVLSAFAMLMGFMATAAAELPAGVASEIAGAKADIGELGALIFGVVIAIAIWGWFRRTAR